MPRQALLVALAAAAQCVVTRVVVDRGIPRHMLVRLRRRTAVAIAVGVAVGGVVAHLRILLEHLLIDLHRLLEVGAARVIVKVLLDDHAIQDAAARQQALVDDLLVYLIEVVSAAQGARQNLSVLTAWRATRLDLCLRRVILEQLYIRLVDGGAVVVARELSDWFLGVQGHQRDDALLPHRGDGALPIV